MSDDARRVPGLSICLMTTSSMVPTISPGELLLVEPAPLKRLRPGDLLLVDRGGKLKDVHRLLRQVRLGGVAHVVTKGDANMAWDPPLPSSLVAGRVVMIGRPKGRWLSIDGWRGFAANAAAAGDFSPRLSSVPTKAAWTAASSHRSPGWSRPRAAALD